MEKNLKVQYENKYIQVDSFTAFLFNFKLIQLYTLLFMFQQSQNE